MKMTVRQFFQMFPDDKACLHHLFKVRFGQGHTCPKCHKSAKWYMLEGVRAFTCQWCGHHLHPTVGTPFEASRTPLQLWFYAIYLFTTTRHGVSAKELQRQLGVTYKCAWRMGHQIRQHMADIQTTTHLKGDVEVDETMVGGKRKGKRGRGAAGKVVVFGMMQRDGHVNAQVVPNVRRKTLEPIIQANVCEGTRIHSDELRSYMTLSEKGYKHSTVRHGVGEFVVGDCHVNSLEGYWSQLKKSIASTHIHVSGKYLERYVKEFQYRFNHRKEPWTMFPELLATFSRSSS
jgi:transposase